MYQIRREDLEEGIHYCISWEYNSKCWFSTCKIENGEVCIWADDAQDGWILLEDSFSIATKQGPINFEFFYKV